MDDLEKGSTVLPGLRDPQILHGRFDHIFLVLWGVALSEDFDLQSFFQCSADDSSERSEALGIRCVVQFSYLNHNRTVGIASFHRLC